MYQANERQFILSDVESFWVLINGKTHTLLLTYTDITWSKLAATQELQTCTNICNTLVVCDKSLGLVNKPK